MKTQKQKRSKKSNTVAENLSRVPRKARHAVTELTRPKTPGGGALEKLALKTFCEMCGAANDNRQPNPLLEPAYDPNGEAKTLCQDCRIGSAELLAARLIYIDVSGGVVQYVDGLRPEQNYDLIDWDNIESDPEREWHSFDAVDRAYIREKYPEEYQKFFASLDTDSRK